MSEAKFAPAEMDEEAPEKVAGGVTATPITNSLPALDPSILVKYETNVDVGSAAAIANARGK